MRESHRRSRRSILARALVALRRGAWAKGRGTPAQGDGLRREQVVWAYRVLLDREPESDEQIAAWLTAWKTTRDLRRGIMSSSEFREKNPGDLAYTPERAVVIAELRDSSRLFVDLSDVAIGLNIIRGRYEENELEFVRRTVTAGQTVLDVGANVGFYAMQMGTLVGSAGRVYAYEPMPQNADLLERSIRENGMEGRVFLRRAVVAEEHGEARLVSIPLEKGALNSGGAYLQPPGGDVPPNHEVHPVAMVSLDTEKFPAPIDFIKIDVEGAEPFAFRGARQRLREDRPVILCEINPVQLQRVSGCSPDQLISEMAGLGYSGFTLENGRPAERVRAGNDASIRSVVFEPAHARGEIRPEAGGGLRERPRAAEGSRAR